MSHQKNLALTFQKEPVGHPKAGEDIAVKDIGFDTSATPADGLTLRILHSSLDPYLRNLIRAQPPKEYAILGFIPIGGTIPNGGVAEVLTSNHAKFQAGDKVLGRLPIQQYAHFTAEQASSLQKLDTTNGPSDLRHYVGALGMPGLTAYASLYDIGKPVKGETIFISSAAGAVGQIVGQLAKREGLTVIGSVGSDEKATYLTSELAFDAAFNYKTETADAALKRLAPNGIDIYYENVGGEQLEAALNHLNAFGRIVACGMISQYNINASAGEEHYPIRNLMNIVLKRITFRGFVIGDENIGPVYAKAHQRDMRKWLVDGSVKAKLHEWPVEEADKGLAGLLRGENFGKAVVGLA